jgi:hypothetical protein
MQLRLILLAIAAGVLLATHASAYFLGRAHQETAHVVEAAENTAGAHEANAEGQRGVNAADAALSAENYRLNSELINARAALARFRTLPPPEGRVGAGALVDPAYGLGLLRCVERLRADAPAPLGGDCAASGSQREPALQPVPARALAGS